MLKEKRLYTKFDTNIKPEKSIFQFLLSIFQYLFFAFIAFGGAYSVEVGQYFVLAYAIYAIFLKRDSKLTFSIALFLLITIIFFQIFNQPAISNNIAVYVFELLVIGTIQAMIELRGLKSDR